MLIDVAITGRTRDRLFHLARARKTTVNALATELLQTALQAPWPPADPRAPWPANARVRFLKTQEAER